MKKEFEPDMETTDPYQIIKDNSICMHKMSSCFGKFTQYSNQITALKESHDRLIKDFVERFQELEKGQQGFVGNIDGLKTAMVKFGERLATLEKSQQWDFLKSELKDIEVSYNDLHKKINVQNEKLVEAIFEKQSGVINKNVDKLDKGISKISDKLTSFIEEQKNKDLEAASARANINKKSPATSVMEELKKGDAELKTEHSKLRKQLVAAVVTGYILNILTTIILSVLIYYFSSGSATPTPLISPTPSKINIGDLTNIDQPQETPAPVEDAKQPQKKKGKK